MDRRETISLSWPALALPLPLLLPLLPLRARAGVASCFRHQCKHRHAAYAGRTARSLFGLQLHAQRYRTREKHRHAAYAGRTARSLFGLQLHAQRYRTRVKHRHAAYAGRTARSLFGLQLHARKGTEPKYRHAGDNANLYETGSNSVQRCL